MVSPAPNGALEVLERMREAAIARSAEDLATAGRVLAIITERANVELAR